MSWQMGLILLGLASIAACAWACVDGYRRDRKAKMLRRLNSPYFRQVTDAYYRVGNMSGVGK